MGTWQNCSKRHEVNCLNRLKSLFCIPLLSLPTLNMLAVWGLIFMAMFVKGAWTDPMPLKRQVEVLSKENQKDYNTSDLVSGYGLGRGPCLPLGEPCTKCRRKDNCCGGLICWGKRSTKGKYRCRGNQCRCIVPTARKCLRRNRKCKYWGTQDACCDGLVCQEFRIYQLTCQPHPHNRKLLKNEKP